MTTLLDVENMQRDMEIDSFAVASPAAAPNFMPQVALGPCRTINTVNRARDRALASFWIQRLKPRDDLPESLDQTEKSFASEAKHDLLSCEQQGYTGQKQQSTCEQRERRALSLLTVSKSGCVEQLNLIEDTTPQRNSQAFSVINSRYTSEPAIVSKTVRQAELGPCQVVNGMHADGNVFATSSQKPPLQLPMNEESISLVRNLGYESQGLSSWPAYKLTCSGTNVKRGKVEEITSSVAKEPVLTLSVPEDLFWKERHHTLGNQGPGIASLEEKKGITVRKIGAADATHDWQGHIPVIDTIRQDLSASPIRTTARRDTHEGASQHYEERVIATLEIQRPKKINGLAADKLGGVKVQSMQASGSTNNILSKQPVSQGGLHKAGRDQDAVLTTSSTPTFPWEMFVEVGGPSRTARQEFVEVYKKARNELKNQKTSNLVTKVAHNESDSFLRLALRGATCAESTPMAMQDAQTSEAGSQVKILERFEHMSPPEMQKEHLLGRQQFGSLLDRRHMEAMYQEYRSAHLPFDEDTTLLYGQPGGRLHRHLEPSLDPSTHCCLTMAESSGARLGCASGGAPKQCGMAQLIHEGGFLPKLSGKTDLTLTISKAHRPLSKREALFHEEGPAIVADKDFVKQGENQPSRSEVWLQRWHPSQNTASRQSQGHNVLNLDRSEQGLAGAPSVLSGAKERTLNEADSQRLLKKRLIDTHISCQGIAVETEPVDHFECCSEKTLPSAAAMAIVGTAAQQFHSMQPQRKRGFSSFWSGLGIPGPHALRSVVKRGESRHPSEAGTSWKP